MNLIRNFLTTLLCLVAIGANAQPAAGWKLFIPPVHGGFQDIYACQNGDLIACGYNWGDGLARVSNVGELLWSASVQGGVNGILVTVIEAENGDFLLGGQFNNDFTVVRFSSDGQLRWRREYGHGMCNAIIELKNGNFAIAGFSPELYQSRLRFMIVNDDGDPQVDRSYNQDPRPQFWCMRETDNGVVLVSNYYQNNLSFPRLYYLDFEGNVERTVNFNQTFWHLNSWNGIVSSPDGGYVVVGCPERWQGGWAPSIIKVDENGQQVWRADFNERRIYSSPCVYNIPGTGYLIGAGLEDDTPIAILVDEQGNMLWESIYRGDQDDEYNPSMFRAVVRGRDGILYGAGTCIGRRDGAPKGLVMQIGNGDWVPEIFYYSPLDTTLDCLIGDSIRFVVVAGDPFDVEIRYQWFQDDSLQIESDTLFIGHFDEPGESTIRCHVSTPGGSKDVVWHINVTDFFIAKWSPDSIDCRVRRGATIPFSIDSIASLAQDEVLYEWTHINRAGDRQNIGDAETVEFTFLRSGSETIEGVAFQNVSADNVIWNIDVAGSVSSYYPESLAFEAQNGSSQWFEVVPVDDRQPDDEIRWFLNGDQLPSGRQVEVRLPDQEGIAEVMVVVEDLVANDTVKWEVTVRDLGLSNDLQPAEFALSASPNPFNSTVTISYSAGQVSKPVSLAVYDTEGRLVADLSSSIGDLNRRSSSGEQKVVWEAGDIPAGVYIVRLSTAGKVSSLRLVIVK